MASPPSTLPDDLMRKQFLQLPTAEDPTCLLRISLTNKNYHRILADPDFHSLLEKEVPSTPGVLGFLTNTNRDLTSFASHFVVNDPGARLPPQPRLEERHGSWGSSGRPAARDLSGLRVLDSRHSRVLFLTPSPSPGAELRYNLVVWIPLTNEYSCLPQPEPPLTEAFTMIPAAMTDHIKAAVLCSAAAGAACDHRNCHGGHFRVALVYLDHSARFMSARIYSSVTGVWSAPRFARFPINRLGLEPGQPSTLVGDTLYFRCELGYVLAYQLGVQQLSFFEGPPNSASYPWGVSLMPMDGGLGCMCIEDDEAGLRLRKWSRKAAADGVAKWTKGTAIEVKKLLPHAALQSMQLAPLDGPPIFGTKLELLGSAEGTSVIFLGTWSRDEPDAVYMVDVNSRGARAEKVFDVYNAVVPYISSHIPVPATAPK